MAGQVDVFQIESYFRTIGRVFCSDDVSRPIQDIADNLLCDQVALSVSVNMYGVVVVRLDQGDRDFPGNGNSCQSFLFILHLDTE